MMKKVFALLGAVLLSISAFAADTVKGVNQNEKQETVGTKHIYAAQSTGGVLYYRSSTTGSGTHSLTDANGSQFNKVLTSFGTGNAIQAANGWYYDLSKIKVMCYNSQTTTVTIDGVSVPDYISDNCALATAANNQ